MDYALLCRNLNLIQDLFNHLVKQIIGKITLNKEDLKTVLTRDNKESDSLYRWKIESKIKTKQSMVRTL